MLSEINEEFTTNKHLDEEKMNEDFNMLMWIPRTVKVLKNGGRNYLKHEEGVTRQKSIYEEGGTTRQATQADIDAFLG